MCVLAQTLGYWSIRGLGQAIRYVLAFTGTPFADVRYQQGGSANDNQAAPQQMQSSSSGPDLRSLCSCCVCLCSAPEFSRSAWMDVKSTLDLEFANLPYYTEGSSASGAQVLSLTQSTTILRHLARKHLLYGASLADQARCDLVLDTAYDFKSLLVDTAYSRNRAESLASFAAKSVPHYFAQFEGWRAKYSNQRWIAGDNLSIADFFLYEMICQTEIMVPGCMEAYPRLQAFRAQFAALPAIAAYIKSSHYIERPLNNMAGFQ